MSLLSRFHAWITAEALADEPGEEDESMFDRGQTKVVIGLGNPGRKYAGTRHNMGFTVVEELAKRTGAPTSKQRMKAEISETRYGDDRLVLAMPQTYMNDSGLSVREIVRWYKVPLDDVMIVYDDLDLAYGHIRVRPKGSPGGHNGMKSIFRELGTQEIPRVRVGIGRGSGHHTVGHVLSRFTPEEQERLPTIIDRAANAVELWMRSGIIETMNQINANETPV